MKLWIGGKVTGAAVGMAVGGPVGALVGLAVGHALDHFTKPEDVDELLRQERQERQQRAPLPAGESASDREARLQFTTHLVALFAAVAQADGNVRREEVRTIRSFFSDRLHISGKDLEFVRLLLKKALRDPVDVEAAARTYKAASTGADRMLFVQALYEMVCDRGEPNPAQQKMINQIVVALDLSEADHHTIRSIYFSVPGLDEDYALLGLPEGCGDDDLKRAFRTLAAKHHPDKVTHLGTDAVAMAGKRFAEIKGAYDRIRAARGL
ncbi:MAG: TerB family tellurite resistance protein [Deltaproteobacteria bacterium]|nr:TerB family tellurite resistance protein [Deltaproteobacteria bacterium]